MPPVIHCRVCLLPIGPLAPQVVETPGKRAHLDCYRSQARSEGWHAGRGALIAEQEATRQEAAQAKAKADAQAAERLSIERAAQARVKAESDRIAKLTAEATAKIKAQASGPDLGPRMALVEYAEPEELAALAAEKQAKADAQAAIAKAEAERLATLPRKCVRCGSADVSDYHPRHCSKCWNTRAEQMDGLGAARKSEDLGSLNLTEAFKRPIELD